MMLDGNKHAPSRLGAETGHKRYSGGQSFEKVGKLVFVTFYILQQLALVGFGAGACSFGACDEAAAPHVLLVMVACIVAGGGACVYYIGHLSGCGVCLGRPQRNFGLLGSAALGAGLAVSSILLITVAFNSDASPLQADVSTNVGTTVSAAALTWAGAALVFSHALCLLVYEKWYAATDIKLHKLVLLRPMSVFSAIFYCGSSSAPIVLGRQAITRVPTVVIAHRGSSCPFARTFMLQAVDMAAALQEAGVQVLFVSTDKLDAGDMAKAYGVQQDACSCEAGPEAPPLADTHGGPKAQASCPGDACAPSVQQRRCMCVYDEGGVELKRLGVAREQPNPLVSWRSLFCTPFGKGHSEPVACPCVFVLDRQHRLVWRYVAADYRVWPDMEELQANIAHSLDVPQLLSADAAAPVTQTVLAVDDAVQSSQPQGSSPARQEVVLP